MKCFICKFTFANSTYNETLEMNTIQLIEKALQRSYTYTEYKELINQLYADGKTTGNTQTSVYLEYTKLGISRMKRWDKTTKIAAETILEMKSIQKPQTWVVISEAWCGDAAHALPIISKLAEANPLLDLCIVLRDENEALMDEFLTNGGRSIPKLISFSPDDNEILFTWGPRPKGATLLIEEAKAKHGEILTVTKEALQMWFNKDKGKQIAEEVVELAMR